MNAAAETFKSALQGRVDAMIDACTRCGKCVEVCPATEPAGLSAEQRQNPAEVIGGVIDLLRGAPATMRRANGRAAVSSRANASRRATTASIRDFCSVWRASRWRRPRTSRRRNAAPGSRAFARGARRQRIVAAATRQRAVGAARAGPQTKRSGGVARFRVLYRLQRAQDAAHRALGARRHGRARHRL